MSACGRNFNIFEEGAALAAERLRTEQNADNELWHEHNIRSVAQQLCVNAQEAALVQDFQTDVLGALFFMADKEQHGTVPLALFHMDGTPSTPEEQFDILFTPPTSAMPNLPLTLRDPSGDVVVVQDLINSNDTLGMTYISETFLIVARKAIVGSPPASPEAKTHAIRQIFDDFVRGVNTDDNVALNIDDSTAETIWELALFGRPSNQQSINYS
jgi:hypothetical protein